MSVLGERQDRVRCVPIIKNIGLLCEVIKMTRVSGVLTTLLGVVCITLILSLKESRAEVSTPQAEAAALLQLNGATDMARQLAPLVSQQFVLLMQRSNPSLSQRAVDSIEATVQEYLSDQARSRRLIELLAPVYARTFSPEELRALVRFYKTSAGRKLAASMPLITAESAEVGQAWAAEIIPELKSKILSRLTSQGLLTAK